VKPGFKDEDLLMFEQMHEQDRVALARMAENVQRMTEECDRANRERQNLELADGETVRTTLSDRGLPTFSRVNALMTLLERNRLRRDECLSGVFIALLDDPDETVARLATQYAPPDDAEATATLHALLDDPRPNRWSTAASVLARRKDTAVIPRLLGWFHEGDRLHRNTAWSCLCFYRLLEPDTCRALLREAWDAGGSDDADRAMLAVGLLGLGDPVGWDFLVDVARRADDYAAVWAAETVMEHDPALGLDLILHVLDHGKTFEVQWGMVKRIAQAVGLPHVWTVDGLAEARYWVEQQRQRIQSGCVVAGMYAHGLAAQQASPR
jgi:hypothetical protein